jgi:C4-dicarboxylate-specific signal transduction histidine kinase
LQPIFDTIIASATRLRRSNAGTLRLVEDKGLRLVAEILQPKTLSDRWSPPILAEPGSSLLARVANGALVHIPDLDLVQDLHRYTAAAEARKSLGLRTMLAVPMLSQERAIGIIYMGRVRVRPFTDKEIELIMDFAAQAAIALEITRRERRYRDVQMQMAHANRVATMGQLTASIAHELKQPLAAAVTDGDATLRWLTKYPPGIEEAKQSVERIIKGANRASDILGRIHGLVKKASRRTDALNINDAILEVITLIHSEAVENGVTVQTELADHLPNVQGDRIQLQQVILNLIVNAIQAMSGLTDGIRELHIGTERAEQAGVRVAVRDSGPGLSAENLQRLFEPFYTTKPNGMGMGLSICRSIIEDHGGRLSISIQLGPPIGVQKGPPGATF